MRRLDRILSTLLLASVLALPACGGSDKNTATPDDTASSSAGSTSTATPGEPQATCEAMFSRARECTDEYIAMLVDLRISLDMPPGTADAAQSEGRGELIAAAKEEWAVDSAPENASHHCSAMIGQVAAEQVAAMTEKMAACEPEASCSAYADCLRPLHEEMFSMAHKGPAPE